MDIFKGSMKALCLQQIHMYRLFISDYCEIRKGDGGTLFLNADLQDIHKTVRLALYNINHIVHIFSFRMVEILEVESTIDMPELGLISSLNYGEIIVTLTKGSFADILELEKKLYTQYMQHQSTFGIHKYPYIKPSFTKDVTL